MSEAIGSCIEDINRMTNVQNRYLVGAVGMVGRYPVRVSIADAIHVADDDGVVWMRAQCWQTRDMGTGDFTPIYCVRSPGQVDGQTLWLPARATGSLQKATGNQFGALISDSDNADKCSGKPAEILSAAEEWAMCLAKATPMVVGAHNVATELLRLHPLYGTVALG